MNERNQILKQFSELKVDTAHGGRAPNKPLLALWAIGRCLRGKPRVSSYEQIDEELGNLLRLYAPRRQEANTHDPFWRLEKDGIWEVDQRDVLDKKENKSGSVTKKNLIRLHAQGGLREDVYELFQADREYAMRVAHCIIVKNFPPSYYSDILDDTLIPDIKVQPENPYEPQLVYSLRSPRDPVFRDKVLSAYASQCAVCKFAVKRDKRTLALEAAHIKWHVAKGPATVENGLALCSLHHSLFDKGAFTLTDDMKVKVAEWVAGEGSERALWEFHDKTWQANPGTGFQEPNRTFLHWHWHEVFKQPEALLL